MSDDAPNNEGTSGPITNPPPDVDIDALSDEYGSVDSLISLLAVERRRTILSYLEDRPDETVPVDDLQDAVIERERLEPGALSPRERVEIDLHHVQLPKLADAGVIEHDPVDETVRYAGPAVLAYLLATVDAIEEER